MISTIVYLDQGIHIDIENEEPTDEEMNAMRNEFISLLNSMTLEDLREYMYLESSD